MDKLRCYITEAVRPIPQPSIEVLELKRERAEKAAEIRLKQKRIRSERKSEKKQPNIDEL